MHRIAIMIAPLFVAGCAALPPQLALVTQAADGVSYVFTGKSSTDHIVSAALRRDCVVIRVVQGEAICKPRFEDTEQGQATIQVQGGQPGATFDNPGSGDQMMAIASGPPPVSQSRQVPTQIASATARPVPLAPQTTGAAPGMDKTGSKSVGPEATAVMETDTVEGAGKATAKFYYLVIGDYRDFDKALDRAGSHRDGVATIVTRQGSGAKTHRVMIGPYALGDARKARRAVPLKAAQTAWLARACSEGADKDEVSGCMDLGKTWR